MIIDISSFTNIFNGKSKLFWEYARLLKELKPKYFLLENVKMKKEYQNLKLKTTNSKQSSEKPPKKKKKAKDEDDDDE